MRRILAILCVLLAFAACDPPPPKSALDAAQRAKSSETIGRVLDDWHDAAAKVDFNRYFGHLAEDAVFLGTDATERWSKKAFSEYAKPIFAKGKAWSFQATRRAIIVAPSNTLAWFDEDLHTEGLGPARGSGVVALRDGAWRIVHYNLTITVPNERFDLAKEAAGGAHVLAAPPADPTARLAWLSGSWVRTANTGERFEESWLPPSGATMIGSGRSTKGNETVFFEHLRVVVRDGKLVYVAQPLGKPPTEFVETQATADEVVFENKAHDWPKRITYKKTGTNLAVRVEGDAGQPVEAWTMHPAVVARGD